MRQLPAVPTWFFSSGPLDDSAARGEIPPTAGVKRLMKDVGARGHATFGGRLTADAKVFIASKMAKTRAGDWRDPTQLHDRARQIASSLTATAPTADAPAP